MGHSIMPHWVWQITGEWPMMQHRVDSLNLHGETHYAIFVSYLGNDYVFRYAYQDHDRAIEVARNLDKGNKNCDDATNVAFNYWLYPSQKGFKLSYARKTTAKDYWHIIRSEV